MQTSFSGVRFAIPEDEPDIYNLLMLQHRECGLFSFSDRKVREQMARGTQRMGGVIGVVDGENGVEATIGMMINQSWYSDDWHLDELWNFVHPAHRKDGHAAKLVNFSKWCADNLTLPLLISAVLNKKTEAKYRLYKRMVPVMGGIFLYNNSDVHSVEVRNG